jgi:hypothetical protein
MPPHAAQLLISYLLVILELWSSEVLPASFAAAVLPAVKYKADYQPSDLLCPVAKVWVRMSPAIEVQLDAHRYVVLSRLPGE